MALGLFGGGWVERQDPQLEPLHLQMLWVPPSWCDVSSHKTLADHSLVEIICSCRGLVSKTVIIIKALC